MGGWPLQGPEGRDLTNHTEEEDPIPSACQQLHSVSTSGIGTKARQPRLNQLRDPGGGSIGLSWLGQTKAATRSSAVLEGTARECAPAVGSREAGIG